ncbi:MAG: hypothetical protein OEZ54_00040 [Gemmatimonadota bacterium]|nr:hypothetical protein [Gemmatimonadota bacterium]
MRLMDKRFDIVAICAALAIFGSACGNQSGTDRAEAAPAVERAPETGEVFFGSVKQLTFGGQNAEAYFSADGRTLIFQRTDENNACDQQFTMNLDGSDMQRVSDGTGRTTCGFYYSGDDRILYSSTSHVSEECPPMPDMSRGYVWPIDEFDIYTANADGSDIQRLTNEPTYDAEATLSRDGSTIAFTSTRDGDLDIYTMNVDGSNLKRLTSTVGYDGGPFFSPDGTMIVYRAWHPTDPQEARDYQNLLADGFVRPSRMEIWVMNSDGTEQRQITDIGGANFAPFFHPGGSRIIFSSNHKDPTSRNFDLFLIDLDGSNLTQVTTESTFDGFPMFSPDGKKLVFASNRHGEVEGETNIFIADWVEPNQE